ncbi:MAG: exodeoxyribonuclease VII small subunit [Acidobacteriota bacterium]
MKKDPKEKKDTKDLKFEAALDKLESIVKKLEEGETSLEDSLKLFEEGVRLSRLCGEKLDMAQRKIEILMKTDKGDLEASPFDPGGQRGSGAND